MKTITICGSLDFYKEMLEINGQLIKLGWEVLCPKMIENITNESHFFADLNKEKKDLSPKARIVKKELIEAHFQKIKKSDAILVLNLDKKGIKGYIGGNTFLEMGAAFSHKKDIFVYQDLPDMPYLDEMSGMLPTVISKNLANINLFYKDLPIVYVGSTSSIKINAVRRGFRAAQKLVDCIGIKVSSEISDQPKSFDETMEGLFNRLKNLKKEVADKPFEFLAVIESGVGILHNNEYYDFNMCLVEDQLGNSEIIPAMGFKLSKEIKKVIFEDGLEMGPYYQKKYNIQIKDPISIDSGGFFRREDLIASAIEYSIRRLEFRNK